MLTALSLLSPFLFAQILVTNDTLSPKVQHAEPLFIDLIRDLGARKGEKEWNVGLGMVDQLRWDKYETLVEYEWAVRDRLGLEIEVPFTFYAPVTPRMEANRPANRIESLKLAAQWSFWVSPKYRSSLALGYIHQLTLVDIARMGRDPLLTGNVFNPFLVAAKRLGSNWHSLVYTGPEFQQQFGSSRWHNRYAFHASIHYMIPDSRNFVGIEANNYWETNDFDLTLRPQMRLAINEHLLVGIAAGIPVKRENERMSSFIRLIYEPR